MALIGLILDGPFGPIMANIWTFSSVRLDSTGPRRSRKRSRFFGHVAQKCEAFLQICKIYVFFVSVSTVHSPAVSPYKGPFHAGPPPEALEYAHETGAGMEGFLSGGVFSRVRAYRQKEVLTFPRLFRARIPVLLEGCRRGRALCLSLIHI